MGDNYALPNRTHQRISMFLSNEISNYVKAHGAPDWIIEIVSPGSKVMEYFTKLFKYRNAGVREYWIVDPVKQGVIVYQFLGWILT